MEGRQPRFREVDRERKVFPPCHLSRDVPSVKEEVMTIWGRNVPGKGSRTAGIKVSIARRKV